MTNMIQTEQGWGNELLVKLFVRIVAARIVRCLLKEIVRPDRRHQRVCVRANSVRAKGAPASSWNEKRRWRKGGKTTRITRERDTMLLDFHGYRTTMEIRLVYACNARSVSIFAVLVFASRSIFFRIAYVCFYEFVVPFILARNKNANSVELNRSGAKVTQASQWKPRRNKL